MTAAVAKMSINW